jgi:YaiO family outer membrane protein
MTYMALLLSVFAAPWAADTLAPATVTPPHPTPPTPPTELFAGVGYEALTADMAAWKEVLARLHIGVGPGVGVHVQARGTDRFGRADTQVQAGMNARAGGWSGAAEVAVSPTGNVLPTLSVLAEVHRDLGRGWVVGAGGRYLDHDIGPVRIGTFITDYYAGDYRLGYTLSMGFVDDASAAAHRVSASRYYGDGSGVTALVGTGQSVERLSVEDLLITDILAVAVWGVHWASPRIGITWGASFNRHGALFDRRGMQLGARVRM